MCDKQGYPSDVEDKQAYADLISAQVKTLSFLCYALRLVPAKVQVSFHHSQILRDRVLAGRRSHSRVVATGVFEHTARLRDSAVAQLPRRPAHLAQGARKPLAGNER